MEICLQKLFLSRLIRLLAVPTPILSNKTVDMSYVVVATESILPFLKKGEEDIYNLSYGLLNDSFVYRTMTRVNNPRRWSCFRVDKRSRFVLPWLRRATRQF